jgi:hypothetical protein
VHAFPPTERRRAERIAVDLPLQVRCNGQAHDARTINVSAEGVAAMLGGEPQVGEGDHLAFSFTLEHVEGHSASLMEGDGRVVRVQPRESCVLVAFRAQCLSLIPVATGIPGAGPS